MMNVMKKSELHADCNQNIIGDGMTVMGCLYSMMDELENDQEIKESNNINTLDVIPKYFDSFEIDKKYSNQLVPEKDQSKCPYASSTVVEEMMSFLGSVEDSTADVYGKDCYSYFPSEKISEAVKADLMSAKLQIEEKNAALNVVREQIRAERKSACEKLENQRKNYTLKLEEQEKKFQAVIKRHQKFIRQLLTEKKELTGKCNLLAQKIKEIDTRVQKDIKVLTDRHSVELRKAKEFCAASEKIRRERWVEAKTTKIKEMTVKGLEPELRSMVEQHQQEIEQIRSAHITELQEQELRMIRRTNQQLEQLRLELVASHEKVLTSEKEILTNRYKKMLNEQEVQFQEQQRLLIDKLEREKLLFEQEEKRRAQERDKIIQQAYQLCQKQITALKQQQEIEIKTLKETLGSERDTQIAKYKRENDSKLEAAEIEIRSQYEKERDRQIEVAIARLEKETTEAKMTFQKSFENKLRCLKEQYDAKLQAAVDSEDMYKEKLASRNSQMEKLEVQLRDSENKLHEYLNEINMKNEVLEKITEERDNARKYVRKEIELEKQVLEDKIASLYQEIAQINTDKDGIMIQLHSRIKLVMTKKMLTIRNLTQENDKLKCKCKHLEQLLDQQRKEYILTSL